MVGMEITEEACSRTGECDSWCMKVEELSPFGPLLIYTLEVRKACG